MNGVDTVANDLQIGWALNIIDQYETYFRNALEEFCNSYWPCSFESEKGRCVNVKTRHEKGHQNASGKIIRSGLYMPGGFSAPEHADPWISAITSRVVSHQKELKQLLDNPANKETPDTAHMWRLHAKHMMRFYREIGSASQFLSHGTCFCCLMAVPEHALPCGHVLCHGCIQGYGEPNRGGTQLLMTCCPLHADETQWPLIWPINCKPEFSGVRMLSLDG